MSKINPKNNFYIRTDVDFLDEFGEPHHHFNDTYFCDLAKATEVSKQRCFDDDEDQYVYECRLVAVAQKGAVKLKIFDKQKKGKRRG